MVHRQDRLVARVGGLSTALALLFCAAAPPASRASVTLCLDPVELVSVSPSGDPGACCSGDPSLSSDGRFVAFVSTAADLVSADTNQACDVFVRDRVLGRTERVSVSSDGAQGDAGSGCQLGEPWQVTGRQMQLSADGRFVVFSSVASNLVAGDTNGAQDIFVHDRVTGRTERISISTAGEEANGVSRTPVISSDGRYVGFASEASNLVPGDTNGVTDVFVRDRLHDTTERVSMSTAGEQANQGSAQPSISADGMLLAFASGASNLVPGDTNGAPDVFVRDRTTAETVRVSVTSDGEQANGTSRTPAVSGNGVYVAFESSATNLSAGQIELHLHIHNLQTHETIAVPTDDRAGNYAQNDPCFSFDGRALAYYWSWAYHAQEEYQVVVFDQITGRKTSAPCGMTFSPAISPEGDFVAFGNWFGEVGVYARAGLVVQDFQIQAGAGCVDGRATTLSYTCGGDCTQVRFRNAGGEWSAWEACAGTRTWTLSAGTGVKTVEAQCKDALGDLSPIVSDTIFVPTFADVPCANPGLAYVEALVSAGITNGCSADPPLYCPYGSLTRAQMAVFLCRAAGKGPLDRATPTFCDVPKTNPYYGWIERLADADSWGGNPPTIGCAWLPCKQYCPSKSVTRDEMAAFLVRATGRLPVSSCAGMFPDVDRGGWACPYIERIADPASWPGGVAVTSGCALNPLRYCPKSAVTRGQMAVFLIRAFGIAL